MADWKKNFPEQKGKTFVFSHYGLAPSVVFRNSKLNIGAKAVYGYLCTYINGEQMKKGLFKAWLSRERILKELNISVNTFGKYLNELKDAKFVKVEQRRRTLKEGRQGFSSNLYTIQAYVPDETISEQPTLGTINNPDLDPLKSCDAKKVNTSNTKGLSTTITKSNTKISPNILQDEAEYWRNLFVSEKAPSWPVQKE